MVQQDEVRLVVPALPAFCRLARVTATGMASRLGFTYDEVEDLRLAIDELCFALVGTKGRPGELELHFSARNSGLAIRGTLTGDGAAFEPRLSDLSKQILGALVDDYGVLDDGGQPTFQLSKTRR